MQPNTTPVLKIKVPPGVGDSIWLIQKLINTGEKYDFALPDSRPQRGKQVFDHLPSISLNCTYEPFTFSQVDANNAIRLAPNWEDIVSTVAPRFHHSIFLSCNEHLDTGHRIENFLPDLPTAFRLPWVTSREDKKGADRWLPKVAHPEQSKVIGLYTSSLGGNKNWKGWMPKEWQKLVQLIHYHNPEYKFLLIGADWDADFLADLNPLLAAEKVEFETMLMRPFGEVIEVMKRLRYFFAFPSGMGIMAPTLDCPVYMFYPNHLNPMIDAWAHPDDIESGLYHGSLFIPPHEAFTWAASKGKL